MFNTKIYLPKKPTKSLNGGLAEVICDDFRQVVDNGGNAVESRWASELLEMPEEEVEDNSRTDAHEPRHEEENCETRLSELLHHHEVLGHLEMTRKEIGSALFHMSQVSLFHQEI